MIRRALAGASAITLLTGRAAFAEDGAHGRWDPGRTVTSPVGEDVRHPSARHDADGVYGRFDGDLDIGLGIGADFTSDQIAGALRGTLHYFWMAGVFVEYADAFDEGAPDYARIVSVGVDVRPLFVPRWVRNRTRGPRFIDLTIDSLSLGLGAFWSHPTDEALGDERGFEGSLGFGIPLFGRASGPWLEARGMLRWADVRADGRTPIRGAGLVTLSWHTLVETPLVHDD